MSGATLDEILARIARGLEVAREILDGFAPGSVTAEDKGGGDPVTAADHAVDEALRRFLPREGEGWLSEETADDRERLACERVWVVDPLDGTREFVAGIPEWCVSIAYVVRGEPLAGGILNPATGERVVGARGSGVAADGRRVRLERRSTLEGALVLASRSEVGRGEWARYASAPFRIEPTGSVAYKLARVAAGRADATWTLVPKHEWDVAAGTALVLAAGGEVYTPGGGTPRFNQAVPRVPGFVAHRPGLRRALAPYLRSGSAR